jgi:hypothetical protein
MLKTNVMRGIVFAVLVGVGSLQAGEPPPPPGDCRNFDMVEKCASVPGATGDNCNEWLGAITCRELTLAPESCDVITSVCTAAGCGSQQTVTCQFSGTYDF